MKRKIILLFTSLAFLASCGDPASSCPVSPTTQNTEGTSLTSTSASTTPAPSSSIKEPASTPSAKDDVFYLTGNLALNESTVSLSKDNDVYSYKNLLLRRGDSFTIFSEEKTIKYADLVKKDGFTEGKNNYIQVTNEGIYNLSLAVNDNQAQLTLTKVNSSYQSAKIIFLDDKEELSLTKNEDYTFSIENVDLRYNEKFNFKLDDEVFTFDDVAYNDIYFSALRFENPYIATTKKGKFNFKFDFTKDKVLEITSPLLVNPNILPTDIDSLRCIIESVSSQFSEKGTKLTVRAAEEINSAVTITNYEETIQNNQHYYKQSRDADEYLAQRASIIKDGVFYELNLPNDPKNNSIKGKIIGEAPAKEEDETSTIVKNDKEYITEEKARSTITNGSVGFQSTLQSYFRNVLEPRHIISVTDADKEKYENTLQISTAKYVNSVGDTMKVIAKNIEKKNDFYASKRTYVENLLELNLNEDGYLTNGKVTTKKYNGNDVEGTSDDDLTLKLGAKPAENSTYTFKYEYEARKTLTTFSVPLDKYIITELEYDSPISVVAGDNINEAIAKPLVYMPMSATPDLANYTVMQYNSDYIYPNYDNTIFYAKKSGTTTVVMGNKYNDVTCNVTLNIAYKEPTKFDIAPTPANGTYYVNQKYDFTVTVPSYCDPVITVTSSDPTKVKLFSIDSEVVQNQNNKAKFTLHMLEATTEPVTITIASKNFPRITQTFTINVLPALTLADIAKDYYVKSGYSSPEYQLTISEDGNALLKAMDDSTSYAFKVKIENSVVKLDTTNASSLKAFNANFSRDTDYLNTYALEITEATTIDDVNLIKKLASYQTTIKMITAWDKFIWMDNMVDSEKNVTLHVKYLPTTSNIVNAVLSFEYEEYTYQFEWTAPTSSSSTGNQPSYSFKRIDSSGSTVNSSFDTKEVTLTETGLTLHFAYSSSYQPAKSFDIAMSFTK